ncbi:hypothetical protein HG530_009452 [Fusarium avenaceum]|nr:hypothetical protein HG530_009452 [Fusarium avenaceum]
MPGWFPHSGSQFIQISCLRKQVDHWQKQLLPAVRRARKKLLQIIPVLPKPALALLGFKDLRHVSLTPPRWMLWTYLRFSILVYHLTADENGYVVLLLLLKYVVCYSHDLDGADLKACFFESLSLSTGEEALAVIEMTTWELDSA